MAAGLFIALEGIDGSGTTTQARLLAEWLQVEGQRPVLTAEPTDGPIGATIRQILQGRLTHEQAGRRVPVDEVTLALLFAADRSHHLQSVVLPALDAGRVVLSDRHYLSSVAYQSLGVTMAWVEQLNARFRRPDLTVLLDVEPELAVRRKRAAGQPVERYEFVAHLERVRANYHEAIAHARAAGERVETLDGGESIEAVQARLRQLAAALLEARREGDSA
jgi:dTMP kinase